MIYKKRCQILVLSVLFGNKIDFFKNIDHEIQLLNSSNYESINTLINIGKLFLRPTLSEFVNECGQKLGFAIEIEETTQKSKS